MKVVILCGGFGTRIRDVADDIPKPMISIGNYPILWHVMKYYSSFGHKDFVLCLGYKSNIVKNFFLNYETNTADFTVSLGSKDKIEFHDNSYCLDWKVTLVETGLNSMTGARIKKVQKYLIQEDNFMLSYGDGVGNVDLDKLLKFHLSHGKTLTVTGVRPPGRFGELVGDKDGRVTEFNEKTQATGGRISGGFFICRKEIFNYLNDSQNLVFEQEPIQSLVRDKKIMVFEHNGFWQPMDTYRDYLLLNSLHNEGKALWEVWK